MPSRLASPSTKMLAVLPPKEQPEVHMKNAYVLPASADHSTLPAQPSSVGLRTCTPRSGEKQVSSTVEPRAQRPPVLTQL